MARKPRANVYQEVTNTIIRMLENGVNAKDFKTPWTKGFSTFLPQNANTQKTYNGINILVLWAVAMEKEYPHDVWGTYRQWAELGAQVRQGEKAAPVVYVGSYTNEDDEGNEEEGERRHYLKKSPVFNVAQVDGFEITPAERPALAERIEAAETFVANTRAKVNYGVEYAYYSQREDAVFMPDFERFQDTEGATATENAYSTLLHELTHWTAPEDRANRPHDYSKIKERALEELVAELGAAFLCASLGITPQTRKDHAQYLESWLRALKKDDRAIFRAAAQASKAAEYLHSLQPTPKVEKKREAA